MSKEFSLVVCGAPRVGKSTLVNALCGRQVADTSSSLNPHTNKTSKYLLKRNDISSNSIECTIAIHDTPGIESWTEKDLRTYFTNLMKESQPLCMIYCASPGSFARLDQLQWLVDTCIQSNIFCAFVCTNKYSGTLEQRKIVLNDFHSLLTRYHSLTRNEDNIKYYGDVALCTAVNSIVYEDRDLAVRKEVEGINELIFGILRSLKDDEKAVGWCYTIADNDSFWSMMQEKLIEFFHLAKPVVTRFFEDHGKEISAALLTLVLAAIRRRV